MNLQDAWSPVLVLLLAASPSLKKTKMLKSCFLFWKIITTIKKLHSIPLASMVNNKLIWLNLTLLYFHYTVHFPHNHVILDYEWKNKLRFVRIYFDTPTFNRITKDRAAKFVDMLSAIGGTMGLLTGFSIISGVEILYFAVKITLKLIKKKNSV